MVDEEVIANGSAAEPLRKARPVDHRIGSAGRCGRADRHCHLGCHDNPFADRTYARHLEQYARRAPGPRHPSDSEFTGGSRVVDARDRASSLPDFARRLQGAFGSIVTASARVNRAAARGRRSEGRSGGGPGGRAWAGAGRKPGGTGRTVSPGEQRFGRGAAVTGRARVTAKTRRSPAGIGRTPEADHSGTRRPRRGLVAQRSSFIMLTAIRPITSQTRGQNTGPSSRQALQDRPATRVGRGEERRVFQRRLSTPHASSTGAWPGSRARRAGKRGAGTRVPGPAPGSAAIRFGCS